MSTHTRYFEIKTATSNKAKLEADINEKIVDAEAAISKIEQLTGSIATGKKDFADATTIRKKGGRRLCRHI